MSEVDLREKGGAMTNYEPRICDDCNKPYELCECEPEPSCERYCDNGWVPVVGRDGEREWDVCDCGKRGKKDD